MFKSLSVGVCYGAFLLRLYLFVGS